MADMTAVCLTGQLRWSPLTLATLRQFVLQPLTHAWRAYYVGPADAEFDQSMPLLLKHFVRSSDDMCAYDHDVTWAWRGAKEPFELHGRDACLGPPRPRLAFNVDRLPVFGVCEHSNDGGLPHMRGGNPLCSLGVSMLMQMWQCAQAIALVERAEARSFSGLWHSRVLKLRTDIFFFHPVELPPIPDLEQPWYSLMEDTCIAVPGATHMMLQHARPRCSGNPVINKKFPDMQGLVDYGHNKGLKMGWCVRSRSQPLHFRLVPLTASSPVLLVIFFWVVLGCFFGGKGGVGESDVQRMDIC